LLPAGISRQDPAGAEMQRRFGGKNNAFAYLLFILIYVPCVATIAAIYRETNLRWALFSVSYLTILAWIVATMFYQISSIGNHPATSLMWILILSGFLIAAYFVMKFKTRNIKF
jgi:ferrous iron transport protein B